MNKLTIKRGIAMITNLQVIKGGATKVFSKGRQRNRAWRGEKGRHNGCC